MAISRNFSNVATITDQSQLASRFTNMINKVNNMINTQGPIYAPWIIFQVGVNEPIMFNTATTEMKQNLIAELSMDKCGAGTVNTFNLTVKYDPFNHGQNPSDQIEALDDLIGDAMSYDFDDDNTRIRGFIQYGYNYTEDLDMISPKYQFILTKATSDIEWSSGMTVYNFEGVSELGTDCNFQANFDAIENWNLLELVNWILYYYYGDENNPPSRIGKGTATSGSGLNYKIDIPDKLFEDAPTISEEAQSELSPWTYCNNLLQKYVSKSDESVDMSTVKESERPRYVMYVTEGDGGPTIHINYIRPKDSEINTKINWDFTWNKTDKNIVQSWNPEVDLYFYLIQKAQLKREQSKIDEAMSAELSRLEEYRAAIDTIPVAGPTLSGKPLTIKNQNADSQVQQLKDEIIAKYNEKLKEVTNQAFEMYSATITLIGIPADPPLCAEIRVIPRILESVSRTAGVYMIASCTDNISTRGVYTTQLKLNRIRSI